MSTTGPFSLSKTMINPEFQSDDLYVDTHSRKVLLGSKELSLTPTSFELLCFLMEKSPAVVSVNELLEQIWRGKVVSKETVKQQIKTLRGQLGDAAHRIESVRGFGYRLTQSQHSASQPDDIGTKTDAPGGPRITPLLSVLFALTIATLVVVLFSWLLPQTTDKKLPLPLVIAALPFERLDANDQIPTTLSRVIQDQLTTELSRQEQVRTLSLSVVDAGHEDSLTPADYLTQFNVHMLVEGSLRNNGNGVSVNIRIVWTRTGMTAWRETIVINSYDENVILREIENVLIPFANKKVAWLQSKNSS